MMYLSVVVALHTTIFQFEIKSPRLVTLEARVLLPRKNFIDTLDEGELLHFFANLSSLDQIVFRYRSSLL